MVHEAHLLKVVIKRPNEKALTLTTQEPSKFTIGNSIQCSYTLPLSPFSERHFLITYARGKTFLMIPIGIECELVTKEGKNKIDLSNLIQMGLVEKKKECFAIPFDFGTTAILKINDVAIGIEYQRPLPREKLEPLPWDLRISPYTLNDGIFLVLLGFFVVSSIFTIHRIRQIEIKPPEITITDKRYAKLILEAPPPPLLPPQEMVPMESLGKKPLQKPNQKSEKRLQKTGLLAHLGSSENMVGVQGLNRVFQGVGVLTVKRPGNLGSQGVSIAYRDVSNVDDLVAGLAARSGGQPGPLTTRTTTAVDNPFEIFGSGSAHQLRSFSEIDSIIRRHLQGIRFLYERHLRHNPNLRGRITLRFTINPMGKVVGCNIISSEMKFPIFEKELIERIQLWIFPKIDQAAGDVSVVYPFTFLPKSH